MLKERLTELEIVDKKDEKGNASGTKVILKFKEQQS
jgi:hypothetical protein